jgi:hypothetical protein
MMSRKYWVGPIASRLFDPDLSEATRAVFEQMPLSFAAPVR